MKWLFLLAITALAVISSCGTGTDKPGKKTDTGNMLHDTMPAKPVDAVSVDSNPADGTKTNQHKGDLH